MRRRAAHLRLAYGEVLRWRCGRCDYNVPAQRWSDMRRHQDTRHSRDPYRAPVPMQQRLPPSFVCGTSRWSPRASPHRDHRLPRERPPREQRPPSASLGQRSPRHDGAKEPAPARGDRGSQPAAKRTNLPPKIKARRRTPPARERCRRQTPVLSSPSSSPATPGSTPGRGATSRQGSPASSLGIGYAAETWGSGAEDTPPRAITQQLVLDHLQRGITEDERRDIQAVLRAPTADHGTQTTGGDVTIQTTPSGGLLIGAYGLHISLDPGYQAVPQ